MMTGNPEENITETRPEDPNVVNDLDLADDEEVATKDNETYLERVKNRIQTYKPFQINQPRPGKKLLVLDVDYTFFDHRSTVGNPLVLRRPYIEHMLEAVYPFYDIIIWSATSMKWIELKMVEMQLFNHDKFKLTAYFDHAAMITVHTEKYGLIDTKPLPVIWGIFPEHYNAKNTIMFDDLRRNFLMNPQNGLKIRPFKYSATQGHLDKELFFLTHYLLLLKDLPDFTALRHEMWESYVEKNQHKLIQTHAHER